MVDASRRGATDRASDLFRALSAFREPPSAKCKRTEGMSDVEMEHAAQSDEEPVRIDEGLDPAEDESTQQAPAIADDDELQRPAECVERGPSPPFGLVAGLFEKLELSRGKKDRSVKDSMKYKHDLLDGFFEVRFTAFLPCHADGVPQNYRKHVGYDLHPIIRLLVPDVRSSPLASNLTKRLYQRDRLRNTYGVKEKLLAEAYIGAFGLSKNTSAAERLINWKAPRTNNGYEVRVGAGDFSMACYNEIKLRSTITSDRGKLSIAELNSALDKMATAKDKHERILVIRHLYETMTAVEQKWVIRIILKGEWGAQDHHALILNQT
jgi:DNA ligase-4